MTRFMTVKNAENPHSAGFPFIRFFKQPLRTFRKVSLMLDFTGVSKGTRSIADVAVGLTKADLYQLTDEMIDTMLAIIADAVDADVSFEPDDPNAHDPFARPEEANKGWSLGHVIVHVTASSEESAALALTLACGIQVEGRSRNETPWQSVTTVAQVRQRLEESRHMRKALLDAWPDEPHLAMTYTPSERAGTVNALGRFIAGLYHDGEHLEQLQEIMRQGRKLYHRGLLPH
jgi:hypothetical protein